MHSTPCTGSDGLRSDSGPEMSPERDGDIVCTTVERLRRRRKLTTQDDANFTCPDCGKFFHRSYNYKQHLATHDPSRQKPHMCPHPDCDKSFVRKTDLDRHDVSVSLTFLLSFYQQHYLASALSLPCSSRLPLSLFFHSLSHSLHSPLLFPFHHAQASLVLPPNNRCLDLGGPDVTGTPVKIKEEKARDDIGARKKKAPLSEKVHG